MKITRRNALIGGAMSALAGGKLGLADDAQPVGPPYTDLNGQLPALKFTMRLASTGRLITAEHFTGHPVILYFGFTRCADTCPLTMENAARLIRKLGPNGQRLRVLFVTIDPVHDTLPVLKAYMSNFGPPPVMDGLRGTSAELAAFARRYGVGYNAVTNADAPDPVANISHTIAVYAFGPTGQAKYILSSLGASNPELDQLATLMTPLIAA